MPNFIMMAILGFDNDAKCHQDLPRLLLLKIIMLRRIEDFVWFCFSIFVNQVGVLSHATS